MKKFKDVSVTVPVYTREYRVWRNENGKTKREDKKERAVQWIACALEEINDYFDLDACDRFWALFRVQKLLFEMKGIKPSEYLDDVMSEMISAMYAELPKEGKRSRSVILDHEYYFDVGQMWEEIKESYEPPDEVPEVSKEDESPGEVPEVSKVTKLEGVKRAKRKSDS
ncbi:hypothetical protein N9442_03805 [Gammaproteobacteria bacterium]|nr:hypothetical protein [Gammaproteobacteria bacterium]